MCGIVGLLAPERSAREREAIVRRMGRRLAHRGPDDAGQVSRGACTLGVQRLSIIDLDAPAPPYGNEDGTVWCAANGEIYNAAALREEMTGAGHRLRTRVDTEVLPHLYEERDVGLVDALDGMFAFAVWDARRELLILARDRAGEKPLFYWHEGNELAFASELGALLEHPDVRPGIDPVALRRYLLHGFFPAPLSPIAGIRKLPAGHVLWAEARALGAVEVHRFWDLADHWNDPDPIDSGRSTGRLAAELDERLGRAVERRRQSDVPVGVLLSGGLDSASILAHLTEQVGEGVPVFSFGHVDQEFDESAAAARTARHFGAELHRLVVDDDDLAEGLRRVAAGFDEPLGDASTLPTHLLARFARERVKVVLSGEGADELFAGYPTYLGHRLAGGWRRLPRPLRQGVRTALDRWPAQMNNVGLHYLLSRFVAGAERPFVERHHTWFGCLAAERVDGVLTADLVELLGDDDPWGSGLAALEGVRLPDDLSRALFTDFSLYLPDDLLTKVDRSTMLASLEARAPFLDHELAQFAAGLPSRLKVSGWTTKAILRRAVRHRLPREVLSRRKRGFNIPFSRWLLGGLRDEMERRFAPEAVAHRGLLDPVGVGRLLAEHTSRRKDHRKPLFALLALDLWCDRIFGEGAAVPVASGTSDTEQPKHLVELAV